MTGPEGRYKMVRMSDAKRREVLAQLDATDTPSNRSNRRNARRLPYRRTHVSIAIHQPGAVTIECTVPTRDISAGGLSFVYWGFLYKGTVCRCTLARPDGRVHEFEGEVAWCRHLSGPNHLVGIRFRQAIHADQFLERQDRAASHEPVDPRKINGRVLVVCGNGTDRQLIELQLCRTSVEYVCVAGGEQAVEVIGKLSFDLVLCEMDTLGNTAAQTLVAMRMAGTQARFVAVTAETDLERLRRMRDAGASLFIHKPFSEEQVTAALLGALYDGVVMDDNQLVLSSLLAGQGIDDVIVSFVEEARLLVDSLRAAWDAGDVASVRADAVTLRGNGASVGFPQVGAAAAELIAALDRDPRDTRAGAAMLRHLCSLCARLSAPHARAA